MGFEIERFQGEVDEELLCPVCSGVLDDPVQLSACEHAFCSSCINEWLSCHSVCPIDRQPINSMQIKPVPRILRNLLSRLYINCSNASYGCQMLIKLDTLSMHLEECEHNPRRPVSCEQGCGLIIPKDSVKDHNCIKEFRSLVQSQQQKFQEFQQDVIELKLQMGEQLRELRLLKEFMRAMSMSNPTMRSLANQIEQDEISKWANSLVKAKVTRWGGMISTPDALLQAGVKQSLIETGCPSHIISVVMENAHERRWPPGLNTLETRQSNRRLYENYICRRIPGKQAVVVMLCDNRHMNDDMVLDPGLIMIFAHGIE